jgi:dethiobiotin synthetase
MKEKKKDKGFFVTGTGTGVGKTHVSRVLAQAFSKIMDVSYMKPVQTGCMLKKNGGFVAPDYDYVKKSGVLVRGKDEIHVPYAFFHACSPHLAARRAKRDISLNVIRDCFGKVQAMFGTRRGCVLVEGAGGVLVPLSSTTSMINLIDDLKLPVILVAASSLGTLNHTFLSICALQSCGARIAGVVMNSTHRISQDYIYKDNMETIRSFINPVPFLEIGYKAETARTTMEFCNDLAKRFL